MHRQVSTVPPKYLPIPPKLIGVSRKILLVGCRNNTAKETWYTAGWVSPRLNFIPSNSTDFSGLIQGSGRHRLSLNKLNLVRFYNYDLSPYAIELSIARWHTEVYVEIYQYTGAMEDLDTQLDRIEQLAIVAAGK
jgi:hypothetical protein